MTITGIVSFVVLAIIALIICLMLPPRLRPISRKRKSLLMRGGIIAVMISMLIAVVVVVLIVYLNINLPNIPLVPFAIVFASYLVYLFILSMPARFDNDMLEIAKWADKYYEIYRQKLSEEDCVYAWLAPAMVLAYQDKNGHVRFETYQLDSRVFEYVEKTGCDSVKQMSSDETENSANASDSGPMTTSSSSCNEKDNVPEDVRIWNAGKYFLKSLLKSLQQ